MNSFIAAINLVYALGASSEPLTYSGCPFCPGSRSIHAYLYSSDYARS